MTDPETFDIVRMGHQVQAKATRRKTGKVLLGAALTLVGISRRSWFGAIVALCGVHVLLKTTTGRSLRQHAFELRNSGFGRLLIGKTHFGGGTRDHVDEASWESFPASDPPAHTPHVN